MKRPKSYKTSESEPMMVNEPGVDYRALDDQRALIMISDARGGWGFGVFKKLADQMPFEMSDWSRFLDLSARTIQRYRRGEGRFDSLRAERITEILLLYRKGVEVFGAPGRFNTWLETESIALGGMKPKDLLDSSIGIRLLSSELFRIEHGVLA